MGIEHCLACHTCGEFIDLHKSYAFSGIIESERPPIDYSEEDWKLHGTYWEGRGLWFLWKHLSHKVEMFKDRNDDYYHVTKNLKEVFPYKEDLKLRLEQNLPQRIE